MKRLLMVVHAPSDNTAELLRAAEEAARSEGGEAIEVQVRPPLQANAEDVLAADGIVLGTTENIGYMSGALKDFFDRIYYPCLEAKQGLPFALFIRAGHDGTGTKRAVLSICSGLRWRLVAEPLILKGKFDPAFKDQVGELAGGMAAGLAAGIF